MKAFRTGEPEILLPRSHPSAASAASDRLAGGRLEGAALPATLRTAAAPGGASCYCRCCPGAAGSHLPGRPPLTSSWQSRERAREGAGTRRGRDSKAYSSGWARPTQACPALLATAYQWRGDVGSYANLQRPGHSLRKAQSSSHPPSTPLFSPFTLLQIPFPISLLCEQELLDK